MHKVSFSLIAVVMWFGCTDIATDDALTNVQQDIEYLSAQPIARIPAKFEKPTRNIGGAAYSTPFGFVGYESSLDVAIDGAGNSYFTGRTDACGVTESSYASKMNPSGFNVHFICLPASRLGEGIAVDGSGNVYVVGASNLSKLDSTGAIVYSVNFATVTLSDVAVDAAGNAYVSGYGAVAGKATEVHVAKMNAAGTALQFWVTFGGTQNEEALGIAVDGFNNVLVTGVTSSANFPVVNAYQSTFKGVRDAFVTKLNATGNQILYSTYLGGGGYDDGRAIATDTAGNAWVGGSADPGFPTTSGSAQFFSGGGSDGFITKFNATGGRVYSTFLGGSSYDGVFGVAVDGSTGSAYITGFTMSTNYPIRGSAFQTTSGGNGDAMITQISPTGSSFVYSTYLGGASSDNGMGIEVDASKNVYATGNTYSVNFPSNVYSHAGYSDAYITKFLGP